MCYSSDMKLHLHHNRLQQSACFGHSGPRARLVTRAAAAAQADDLGFKLMRKGVKEAASDSILTPRFYTTDFEQMEEMFRCKA